MHDALEMMVCLAASYRSSLTPMTMVMSSFLAGAEMMTFLAPAAMWPLHFSASVNSPVDSMTMSTPIAFHGSSAGDLALTTRISLPFTTRMSGSAALGGIVLEEISQVVRRHNVTHRDDLDILADHPLFGDGAEDEAPDTSKPVDCNLNSHIRESVFDFDFQRQGAKIAVKLPPSTLKTRELNRPRLNAFPPRTRKERSREFLPVAAGGSGTTNSLGRNAMPCRMKYLSDLDESKAGESTPSAE